MGQQKIRNSYRTELLIVVLALVSSLLILIDVGRNLTDEIRITSELKRLSIELEKPQPSITPTLSEEEMKSWTERLKNHSDT